MTQEQQKQIDELLLQLIDGVISDDGFGRLKSWLDADTEAAGYFCRFVTDYAAVKTEIGSRIGDTKSSTISDVFDRELWNTLAESEKNAPAIQIRRRVSLPAVVVEREPFERHSRRFNKSLFVAAMISLAAFLLLAAYVHFNPRNLPPIIGMLTEVDGAVWDEGSILVDANQDLRAGVLRLREGVVGIRLDGGARVILEGPVEADFQSVNSLFLRRGNLVATVGREAVGFVVNTPHGKVLDLGTEFAVQVVPDQSSEIHVFQGEVLFYPQGDQSNFVVRQGNARAVDAEGVTGAVPLRPESFVRSEELVSRVLAREGSDYHRWRASMCALHRDPSLRAHYFYEEASSGPIVNSAPLTAGGLNGLVPGDRAAPLRAPGRWPQKSAVRFERGKNHAIVIPADPSLAINGPITISAWVYYPDAVQMGGHLVSCRQESQINFQFSIFDGHYSMTGQRNRFEFLRYSEKDSNWCHSGRFDQTAGQWYHFAVTHDNRQTTFYVNGKRFERKAYAAKVDAAAAEIVLGAMKTNQSYVLPDGDFDGVVDELMIFARCLGDGEIQSMYEAGRPAGN
jgi:hypothetical protein